MADLFGSITPYQYAFNDPIFWNDPLGLAPYGALADEGTIGGGGPGNDAPSILSQLGGHFVFSGPQSGNYWADGIRYDDWSGHGGSQIYKNGINDGFTDEGGLLVKPVENEDGELERIELGKDGFTYFYEESVVIRDNPDATEDGIVIGAEAVVETKRKKVSDQASTGSTGSAGLEALGWIGVIAGTVEEGASNATPLIQRNLPAISDAGNLVGNWKITSKTGAQVLNYTKSGAKFIGNGAAGVAVVVDGVDLANGDLSGERFSYRTLFNGAAVTVGTVFSGGLGALVGAVGIAGEKAYDNWMNGGRQAIRNAMPTGNWSGFRGFR